MKKKLLPFISLLTSAAMLTSLIGCSTSPQSSNTVPDASNNQDAIATSGNDDIQDAFVELTINEINVNGINTVDININDIKVNPLIVDSIDNIEIEVVSINDSMITLAHENFVSYYGDNIDLGKFFKDVAIGATVVIVCVTLTAVSGPVGTFFGAVVTSEFTATTIAVGAAIDAAVSGYQAYQEGGDIEYILGHMMNGVAEGFKWSAMIAPLTGGLAGISALRGVSTLKKMPAFADVDDKTARAIFKNLSKIVKKTTGLADDVADDALKQVYKEFASEIGESAAKELTEDIFIKVVRNSDEVTKLARRFNPFGVSSDVNNALRDKFWDSSGVSRELADDTIKKLKNGTIKSFDEISDETLRKYIKSNMPQFIELYGKSFSKDFMDNFIRQSLGDDAYKVLKDSITSNDCYLTLEKKYGSSTINDFLDDGANLLVLQCRFGSDNLNNLVQVRRLYTLIGDENAVKGILDGSLKSLDNLSDKTVKEMVSSRNVIANTINNLGLSTKSSDLLDDLSVKSIQQLGIAPEQASNIVANGMRKADIIDTYGVEVYDVLVDNWCLSIDSIAIQSSSDTYLISDITNDVLAYKGIEDEELISQILSGQSVNTWNLTTEQVDEIGGVVSEYYRFTDVETYYNFVDEYAEIRGENISEFLEEYTKTTTITNIRYQGTIMNPTGGANDYIKLRYGDIYMSEAGFPIFDDYAIARLELPNLTGDDAVDIAMANKLHHGTSENIKGYTWHHLEDGKTLILIPTELHDAYRHTGGASLIRNGLNAA